MTNELEPMRSRLPESMGYSSHEEMLFHESQAGRLSQDDLRIMTSIHTADRLVVFSPLPYPTFPPMLREYAIARLNGVRESRDADFHRKIGIWTDAVRKIWHQNQADVEFFRWISGYLEQKGMVDRFLAVQAKITEYEKIQPIDEDLANRVQTLDWKTKLWEGK